MEERRIGPFLLEARIGSGGMGIVYRARYLETGKQVALKILSPELASNERMAARFDRELALLKKLRHPHVVRCFGGGKFENKRFFAMELVEGGSVASLLKRRGKLPWETVIEYGLQICSALECAHAEGIIHRDLKPANLLLTTKGTIKLVDFGLARDSYSEALTATGHTMGTYAYMAPEQIRGEPPLSNRTDLYALGCVLFEMLAGRIPFEGKNSAEVLYQHLDAKPVNVASLAMDCPVWLDGIVAHLLEKDPKNRPRDAVSVGVALREVLEKMANQSSMVKHVTSGGPTTLMMTQDTKAVRKMVASKKPKRSNKAVPIHERVWFLVSSLMLVVSLLGYIFFWPASEDSLFQNAEALMATRDATDMKQAREKYLLPLLERYPNGEHATQAQAYVDEIDMLQVERQIMVRLRRSDDPKTEAERLYNDAWNYEQFGDRLTAMEKYRAMLQLLPETPDNRPVLNLARRQIRLLEESGAGKGERLQVIQDALARADALFSEGKGLEAEKHWSSIVKLYGNNRELQALVNRARTRLSGYYGPLAEDGTEPVTPTTEPPPETPAESSP